MARPILKSKMVLDTKGVQRGFRRMRRLSRDFGRKFGAPIAQATGALLKLGAVAATVTAAGIFFAVKKVSQLGDQMDKMSKRTGIGTEELSRFAFAAELSGTSIESLEKAVKRMAAVILDGEQGLKTATDSFDALGIKMEDVSNKTPEQQLNVFLEALAQVENASTRAALAQEIFGRAGTQLLPMLSDGVKGLKAMKAEADKLGIVITKEQAEEAARFVDEVTRFKKAFTGLLLTAVKFGSINELLAKMTNAVVRFRESAKFKQITKDVQDFARQTINRLVRIIRAWKALDNDTRQALKRLAGGAATFIILWKSGFIAPFVALLVNLLAQVVTILPLIVTNFIVMQGGLAAAAVGIRNVMIAMTKAILAPLAIIVAAIAGFAVGKALDRAFDLSSGLLRAEARIKAFKLRIGATLISTGQEWRRTIDKINENLEKELANIAKFADAPEKLGFGEILKEEFEETIKDIGDILGRLEIPGKEAIDKLIAGFKKAKGLELPQVKDAADALRDIGDAAVQAGKAMAGLNTVVRGFDIGKEAIERQRAKIKVLGPVVGAATREALGLPPKAGGLAGGLPPDPAALPRGPGVGPPVRIPGLSPKGVIPPVILDRVTRPIESIGELNRRQLKAAETTNTKLTAILQQKRVLGWAT